MTNGTVDHDGDKDIGYVAQIKIPKSKISGYSDFLSVNLMLSNTDNGERFDRDLLDGTDMDDVSSWLHVNYK
jgi:hypothetical protein